MPTLLRRRLSKIKGKEKLNKKTDGRHKGRKSQDTRSGKENKKTGISRGCFESYGFRARALKENTVQVSTLEAEVELSDYSGTYVSTVP
jgi:hypothetical protein